MILRRLINRGVAVKVQDQDGRHPLMWAASSGCADAIVTLVNAKASVEARDKDGLSPLHCAASRGHLYCIEALVKICGAQLDVKDDNGCTPLFYSVTLGHLDSTRFFLENGSNPNHQDIKGRSAAHCGASKGQRDSLKLLLEYKGDLWIRDCRGELPLHEAVRSGKKELVRWLLKERSKSVDACNNFGRTSVHIAAMRNNVEMVKILLDNKAFVNPIMRNAKGQLMTPFDMAVYKGFKGCAKFLQLHGGVTAKQITDKTVLKRALETALSARGVSPEDEEETEHDSNTPLSKAEVKHQRSKGENDDMVQSSIKGVLSIEMRPIGVQTDSPESKLATMEKQSKETETPVVIQECKETQTLSPFAEKRNYRATAEGDSQESEVITDQLDDEDNDDDDDDVTIIRKKQDSNSPIKTQLETSRSEGASTIAQKDSGFSDFAVNSPESSSAYDDFDRQQVWGRNDHDDDIDGEEFVRNSKPKMTRRKKQVITPELSVVKEQNASRSIKNRRSARSRSAYDSKKDSEFEISVNQVVQNSLRKYRIERRIFQELLDVKRMQIRAGRANEQVLVKRMAENYAKSISSIVGLKRHDGPFTFKDFEKYLYCQLRGCQYGRPSSLPSVNARSLASEVHVLLQSQKSQNGPGNEIKTQLSNLHRPKEIRIPPRTRPFTTEDLERLAASHERNNLDQLNIDQEGYCGSDPTRCTSSTHRCHHAAEAYVGGKCSGKKKTGSGSVTLPKISLEPQSQLKTTIKGQVNRRNSLYDSEDPLTLELQQGPHKQSVRLPNDTLETSKKYFVTFTINQTVTSDKRGQKKKMLMQQSSKFK